MKRNGAVERRGDRERRSRVGDTVGPYRLLECISSGDVIDTYVAHMQAGLGFERVVVLRCPTKAAEADAKAYGALRSEASIGALLQHPNVLSAREVRLSDGVPFVTLPYFESVSLQRLWTVLRREKERMPLALGLTVGRELCSALRHLHRVKAPKKAPTSVLVHHGLTPDAVEVTLEGDVLLSRLEEAVWSDSDEGFRYARTAFVAPERMLGQYGVRGDLFAVAAILYALVNGKAPSSVPASADSCSMSPTLPSGAPEAFQELMQRAMHVDPAHRFSSALEFQLALEDFAALHQLSLSKVSLGRYLARHAVDRALFEKRRLAIRAASRAAQTNVQMDALGESLGVGYLETVPVEEWIETSTGSRGES